VNLFVKNPKDADRQVPRSAVLSMQASWHVIDISAIIDMIEFLAVNQMAFRGDNDSFANLTDENANTGVFLSLFEYTLRNDHHAETNKSIPSKCNIHKP